MYWAQPQINLQHTRLKKPRGGYEWKGLRISDPNHRSTMSTSTGGFYRNRYRYRDKPRQPSPPLAVPHFPIPGQCIHHRQTKTNLATRSQANVSIIVWACESHESLNQRISPLICRIHPLLQDEPRPWLRRGRRRHGAESDRGK